MRQCEYAVNEETVRDEHVGRKPEEDSGTSADLENKWDTHDQNAIEHYQTSVKQFYKFLNEIFGLDIKNCRSTNSKTKIWIESRAKV